MKRKTFFILAPLLLCGSLSAQTNHYTYNYHHFEHKITVVAQINIDGVEQTSSDYEIGAFDGTAVTGSARIGEYGSNHYHRAYFAIFYNTAYDATFKLYNHATGVELTNCTITDHLGEPLTFVWTDENGYGTNKKPVIFNFTTTTSQAFTKRIIGYGEGYGRYYLIAPPVDDVDPAEIEGMIADPAQNYDLYYFDQTAVDQVEGESVLLEWRNYKKGSFNLVSGMGYLYANKNTVDLTFTGTPIAGDTYEVSLVLDDEARFPGWNLVGNPFAEHAAYIDRPFYVMNDSGTEILAQPVSRGIEAMEGVFVIATEDGESLTFSTTAPSNTSKALTLNLNNGQSIIDRAIVSFGEGQELPKFQLNANSTKVYISKDSQDYAVVCCDNMGEMPVSFKAAQNGTYSININTEGTEMAYLHLIDNMTGADIDMLQSTSYSFEAKTTDYASRFKLVFVSGNADDDNENFAFYYNGNWVIANNSEATLQVIDLNGRILCSQQIEGCTETRIDAAAGIYMIRLVSGNDVKVQKVVVR